MIPRWVARLLWAFRGKRPVRLHLADVPGMETMPSLDGILVGRWGGHYVLLTPKVVVAEDVSHAISGTVEVPAERVLFVQVHPGGAA